MVWVSVIVILLSFAWGENAFGFVNIGVTILWFLIAVKSGKERI